MPDVIDRNTIALAETASLARVGGAETPDNNAPLADPYVLIQTVIPETKDQDLSYLTISESEDPGRDLDLVTEEDRQAGAPPDMTSFGRTRVVHISGVKLVWDSKEPASTAMMAYSKDSTDIGELNLYADTVVIREPIAVPGGDVRIFARRLEFQGNGRIDTKPQFVQQTPVEIGAPGPRGARGGNVSLMVKASGGETWPDGMVGYASGLYIDGERPGGLPLISTKGGNGQKGGPGSTTRAPRAFEPAEAKDKNWLHRRLAQSPVHQLDGNPYMQWGEVARIGTATSDVAHPGWFAHVPSLGGKDILRVILQPMVFGSTEYRPLEDWRSSTEGWPPEDGADARPAGKPGLAGNGGDLVSTLTSATKTRGGEVKLDVCVDLAGGKSGEVGELAKGADPDSPNPYKVQTATVVIDLIDHSFASMPSLAVNRIDGSEQTITLKKGNDAAPLQPDRKNGDSGELTIAGDQLWLHPFQLRAVIQYAKDLFLKGHRDKARALLLPYATMLRPAQVRDPDCFTNYVVDLSAALPSSGPMAEWTLTQASVADTTVADASGNGKAGTVMNGPLTFGAMGASFNGRQYVDATLAVTSSALTVAVWFNPANLSNANPRLVANSHTDRDAKGFQLMFNSGGASGFFGVGNGTATGRASWSQQLVRGAWYHYVGVYDGATVRAYFNGVQVASAAFAGGAIAPGTGPHINIARNPTTAGDCFIGAISDVRIYGRGLSSAEVLALYKAVTPPPGRPTAEWTLTQASVAGTTVADAAGNSYPGTVTNGPLTFGAMGASFNGQQYVDSTLAVTSSALTVSVWFNPANLSNANPRLVANSHTDLDAKGFQLMFNSGGASGSFYVGNGTAAGRAPWSQQLAAGTWYHYVGVYDGTTVRAYLNGAQVASAAFAGGAIAAGTGPHINIARNPTTASDYFIGAISDVRIYERGLSAVEVLALYKAVMPPPSGHTAEWTLTQASVSGTTVADASGNGKAGTVMNGPLTFGAMGASFNGQQYVESTLAATSSALTVSVWFNPADLADLSHANPRLVANSHTDGDAKGFQLMFNSGGASGFFDVGNGTREGRASWSQQLVRGAWYHYVGVYDGTTVRAYLNGAQVASAAFAGGAIAAGTGPHINIARNPTTAGDYFIGAIWDVRIYERGLSAAEVLALYKAVMPPPDDPQVEPPPGSPPRGWALEWRQAQWRDELYELRAEAEGLLARLEDSLDFFGNPVGWAPVLSLKSNLQIYNAEIDDAIDQLWYAYRVRTAFARVQDAAKDLQEAVGTLERSRSNIEQTLADAQNAVPDLLLSLQDKQSTYATQHAALLKTVSDLKQMAAGNVERNRIIDGVFGVIDAACTIIPVGQPYLKAAGGTLRSVSGFFKGDPDAPVNALNGLAKTAGSLKTDLDTYKTHLTGKNIDNQLQALEDKTAEFDALTGSQQSAWDALESKVPLYKEIRGARDNLRAKEREIDQTEGQIEHLQKKIAIWTRERPPKPTPPATDTDEDTIKREEIDKLIQEAEGDITGKRTDLQTKKNELKGLQTTFGETKAALARSLKKYEWSTSAQSTKTEIANKQRALTRKKAERSADIDTLQRGLGFASEGLGTLAETVKQLTLPADEVASLVDAELVKLEQSDAAYTQLKKTVDDLGLEVTGLKGALQSTCAEVDTATRSWLDNRRQARVLNAAIREKAKVLDHFALQFVEKMKADAYERLIRYQYYIQKAYEYLFLAPCPHVDYQLKEMNEKILALLETASETALNPNDKKEMRTLFRSPIIKIRDAIIQQVQNYGQGNVGAVTVELAKNLVQTLNEGRRVRCNLIDAFGLELSNTNHRIKGIKLIEAALATSAGPGPTTLRIYVGHRGLSIVRGRDHLYCFSAGRPGGRAQWGFSWDLERRTATTDTKTSETAEILAELLGLQKNDTNLPSLSEYSPGMFSDFEMWTQWVWPGAAEATPPRIDKLKFEIAVQYEPGDGGHHLLHVKTSDGLKPCIDCGHVGAGNLGGFGNFFRLFPQNVSVYVSAPAQYGTRKFRTWHSTVSDTPDKLKNCRYEFKLDGERALTAVYD
jgi:hypothetical protein